MPAPYDSREKMPPKMPELNGGLYTGEAFAGDWGNVPVIPDVTPLTVDTLLKQQSEPMARSATMQFDPGLLRPGNNAPQGFPVHMYSSNAQFACTHRANAEPKAIPKSYNPEERDYMQFVA